MGQSQRMIDLKEQLKRACLQSGLTANALARQAGLGYPIVYEFMKAQRSITINSAAKLARVLGLELRPVRRGKQKTKRKDR